MNVLFNDFDSMLLSSLIISIELTLLTVLYLQLLRFLLLSRSKIKLDSFLHGYKPAFGCEPREGVIIWSPQNGLFQDLMNVILTSQTGISEMVNDDDDDEWPLGKILKELKTLVNVSITTSNVLLGFFMIFHYFHYFSSLIFILIHFLIEK